MNLVDIAIIAILVLGALGGLRQGFIVMVAGMLGALLALGVAKAEYQPVRHFLASIAPHSPWLTVISYLLVFLVVWGLILIGARMLRRAVRFLMLGPLDSLGGLVVGAFQAALVLALLLYMGKRVPSKDLMREIKHSTLAPTLLKMAPAVQQFFPHIPKH